MHAQRLARLVTTGAILLLPTLASAQALGAASVTGVVRDPSGGVLPGVTVEATSPVLIEGTRTSVSDAEGRYRLVDLRPGTYIVTFTLPGFRTLRREGLQLTADFNATVNVELAVGGLEESITVTGDAPLVDVRNIQQQTTLNRSTLDALPTTQRTANLVAMIPGVNTQGAQYQDVGGMSSDRGQQAAHGQRFEDVTWNIAGIDSRVFSGGNFMINTHTFQEVNVETLPGSADVMTGGVQINIVPREGGNTYSGSFSAEHTQSSWQSSNVSPDLVARGLEERAAGSAVKEYQDIGGGIGGPIKQNKLWFFYASKWLNKAQYQAGNYYNLTHGSMFYTPDLDRKAFVQDHFLDFSLRFTWQAAQKHKIGIGYMVQPACQCNFGLPESGVGGAALRTPEASGSHYYDPNYRPSLTWTYPATNRLLMEAAAQVNGYFRNQKRVPEVGWDEIAIEDVGANILYGSRDTGYLKANRLRTFERFTLSYVTGSHLSKFGLDLYQGTEGLKKYDDLYQTNQSLSYRFRNTVPERVTVWASPRGYYNTTNALSLYAQDQWTVNRVTLNLGLRYDDYRAQAPDYVLPAGLYVPERKFAAVEEIPHWRDLSPRLGVAYDLFGNGRTAIKGAIGRYPPRFNDVGVGVPANSVANSATRAWNDRLFGPGDPRTGNLVPDCVLGREIPGPNGECQGLSDATFGVADRTNTRYAENAQRGFNGQDYNWQASVSLQHELLRNLVLNVGYFRTWYGNFFITDNQAWTPANFDQYCVQAPVDDRLPTSGQTLCGLYDVQETVFNQVDNLVRKPDDAPDFSGTIANVYNGVDISVLARFARGGQVQGGASIGRTTTDNCYVVDSPQQAREGFCKLQAPWSAVSSFKASVVYPLPWSLQASAIYQNVPGAQRRATLVYATSDLIGLGRPLSGGARSVTVELMPLSTYYEDRINQVDLRASRVFALGGPYRVQANFDLYNLFNANNVLAMNTGYGQTWERPIQILGGRLVKVSARFTF